MEEISKVLYLGFLMLVAILLFTPFEAVLEGVLAVLLVAAVLAGFLLHPRNDLFYLKTTVDHVDADRNRTRETAYVAVKVELVRLWLLFLPTVAAEAFLVISASRGILWKFSALNKLFAGDHSWAFFYFVHYVPLLVFLIVGEWIKERWVLRDVEATGANSYSTSGRRVSYSFYTAKGELSGGYCFNFGQIRPRQLESIVFYNPHKPARNRIALGFLFHGLKIAAHGVTDLNMQTVAAQVALAESTS